MNDFTLDFRVIPELGSGLTADHSWGRCIHKPKGRGVFPADAANYVFDPVSSKRLL
jgi:hypothetical protein